MNGQPWVGVDLDGTLAKHEAWQGPTRIGAPIPEMVERVRRWLARGITVKVVTARMSDPDPEVRRDVHIAIQDWTLEHVGASLPATCMKDYAMVELWDDRAVAVETNTGRVLSPSTRGLD